MELKERLSAIAQVLDQNKAEHIEVFNLENGEYMANGVVIASAMADRHLLALLDFLKKDLKPLGEEFLHVDISDEWVAIDLGDILVHIMTESARNKYHMEAFLREFEKKKQARG
ncbi:MAG: ribosome silencing factor [Campylobacterales bacterium]